MIDIKARKGELKEQKNKIEEAVISLDKQRKQLEANYNAICGALQLIAEMEVETDEPQATD